MKNILRNKSVFAKIITAAMIFIMILSFSGCDTSNGPDSKNAGDPSFQSGKDDINADADIGGGTKNPGTTKPPDDGTTRLSFLAAGDNIMHLVMIEDAIARVNGSNEKYNFIDMYKDVDSLIKSADIAFVNVETPIAGDQFPPSGYANFNTPKENAFALIETGFDIVNIANNHMLDKFEQGYKNQLDFWDTQPVLQIGGFRNKQDFENIRIYEKNGVSIAFLSYTYGTNEFLPAASELVVPVIEYATVERQVKAAKPLADLLFVVMHWGEEDIFNASQTQKNLARMMADNGVDVIIGMHPHVLQETEWLSRPDGGKTLVTYSIGNMISGMLGAQNMLGGFLSFDIVKTEKNTAIENARIIPVITHYRHQVGRTGPYLPVYDDKSHQNGRLGFQVYRFEDYTRELAAEHGILRFDSAFSYDYIKSLILQHIPSEFLGDFYKD